MFYILIAIAIIIAFIVCGFNLINFWFTVLIELIGMEISRNLVFILILIILYIIPYIFKKLKINKFLKLDYRITINNDSILYYNLKDPNNNSFNRELLSEAIIKKLKVNRILNILILVSVSFLYIFSLLQKSGFNDIIVPYIFSFKIVEIVLFLIIAFKIYFTKINQIVIDYKYNINDFAYNNQFYEVLKKNSKIYVGNAKNSGNVYSASTKFNDIKISNRQLSFINTNDRENIFRIKELNAFLNFYPTFVVYSYKSNFNVFYYRNISMSVYKSTDCAFKPPVDSVIVDKTYYYANKDGSRDKRFANNKEMYIYNIGQFILSFGSVDYPINLSNVATIVELDNLLNRNMNVKNNVIIYENNKEVDNYLNSQNNKRRLTINCQEKK